MTIDQLKSFFLAAFLINYAIMLIWFLATTFLRNQVKDLLTTLMRQEIQDFEKLNLQWLALYKILVFIFCLAPWLALHFV